MVVIGRDEREMLMRMPTRTQHNQSLERRIEKKRLTVMVVLVPAVVLPVVADVPSGIVLVNAIKTPTKDGRRAMTKCEYF